MKNKSGEPEAGCFVSAWRTNHNLDRLDVRGNLEGAVRAALEVKRVLLLLDEVIDSDGLVHTRDVLLEQNCSRRRGRRKRRGGASGTKDADVKAHLRNE